MGYPRIKGRCIRPGCTYPARSYKPSYCASHYASERLARTDAAADADGVVPWWIRKARRQVMQSLLRSFGTEIEEFARKGHL